MDVKATLTALTAKRDLTREEMTEVMRSIMQGEWTPAQIAGTLIALRCKGESVDEIAACADVMRALSTKVPLEDKIHLVDTCGTGGDSAHTFNISTASALVAAAAGVRIAKHGGRSVSSTCGSADVLESFGVDVNLTAENVARCVDEVGVGFMFAPNYHSAMKHAAPVRRELGIRTLFNVLGPLTNPAGAPNQVLGVFDRALVSKLAQVLAALDSRHVMVVHGAEGLDEISIGGPTFVAELKDGAIREYEISPSDFGFESVPLDKIRVSNIDEAKCMLSEVLANVPGPARDIVCLNAGAAIYVSGISATLADGVASARAAIESGAAADKLHKLIAFAAS